MLVRLASVQGNIGLYARPWLIQTSSGQPVHVPNRCEAQPTCQTATLQPPRPLPPSRQVQPQKIVSQDRLNVYGTWPTRTTPAVNARASVCMDAKLNHVQSICHKVQSHVFRAAKSSTFSESSLWRLYSPVHVRDVVIMQISRAALMSDEDSWTRKNC
jgi:hypothetical protein